MNNARLCSLEGCEEKHEAKGLCKKHYLQEWNRQHPEKNRQYRRNFVQKVKANGHATAAQIDKRTKNPAVSTVHYWLLYDRGPAANYTCVGYDGHTCTNQAKDWSYDHNATDANRRYGPNRAGSNQWVYYSIDVNDYSPRCASCHATLDWAKARGRAA